MGKELTVNGRKLLKTLQKEFSKKYKFLFLAFIVDEDRGKSINVKSLNTSLTIKEARKQFSNEEISLTGSKVVRNMEKYFWKELGIAVQIAVKDYKWKKYYFPIGVPKRPHESASRWRRGPGFAS